MHMTVFKQELNFYHSVAGLILSSSFGGGCHLEIYHGRKYAGLEGVREASKFQWHKLWDVTKV